MKFAPSSTNGLASSLLAIVAAVTIVGTQAEAAGIQFPQFCKQYKKACASVCVTGQRGLVDIVVACEKQADSSFDFGCHCSGLDRTSKALEEVSRPLSTSSVLTSTKIKKVAIERTTTSTRVLAASTVTSSTSLSTTDVRSVTSSSTITLGVTYTPTSSITALKTVTQPTAAGTEILYTTSTSTSSIPTVSVSSTISLPPAQTITYRSNVERGPSDFEVLIPASKRADSSSNAFCASYKLSCQKQCRTRLTHESALKCIKTSHGKTADHYKLQCTCKNGLDESQHALNNIYGSHMITSQYTVVRSATSTSTHLKTLITTRRRPAATLVQTIMFSDKVTSSTLLVATETSTSTAETAFATVATSTSTSFSTTPASTSTSTSITVTSIPSTTYTVLAPTGQLRVDWTTPTDPDAPPGDFESGYIRHTADGSPGLMIDASGSATSKLDFYLVFAGAPRVYLGQTYWLFDADGLADGVSLNVDRATAANYRPNAGALCQMADLYVGALTDEKSRVEMYPDSGVTSNTLHSSSGWQFHLHPIVGDDNDVSPRLTAPYYVHSTADGYHLMMNAKTNCYQTTPQDSYAKASLVFEPYPQEEP